VPELQSGIAGIERGGHAIEGSAIDTDDLLAVRQSHRPVLPGHELVLSERRL
jgi:hypothetical protein